MPAIAIRGNLMFTEHGVIWALWRIMPSEKGTNSAEGKESSRQSHHALLKSITGQPVLLGLASSADPAEVIERTLDGVDLDAAPGAAVEAEHALEALESTDMGERYFWLAIPLNDRTPLDKLRNVATSATAQAQAALGLPRWEPSGTALIRAQAKADAIQRHIPSEFNPVPASPQDLAWINEHMQLRGLYLDPQLPDINAADTERFVPGRIMTEPWIDEGAQSDHTVRTRLNPFSRNYLKVANHKGHISYQVLQYLTASPKGGWEFPGIEFLRQLSELPVDTDFVIRFTIQKARDALQANRRAENNLKDQYIQRGDDTGITGSSNEVDESAAALAGLNKSLSASESEVEVKATVIFASGGPDAATAKAKADYVAAFFDGVEFTFEAPLGGQEALWWAMVPGIPVSRHVTEVEQVTSGAEFSTSLPINSSPLGHETGFLFGMNISLGRPNPFLLQIGEAMEKDGSGSFGVVGENGGGKSVALKTAASHIFDRNGLLVIIDHSDNQEWGFFAKSLDALSTAILDIINPAYTLDPLRNFAPGEAKRMVITLFTLLWGIRPQSNEGALVGLMLDPAYMKEHGILSLTKLMEHLRQRKTGLPAENPQMAQTLLGRMNTISSTNYGAVLFDESLPPLPLDHRALVFCTHGLQLPNKVELSNQALKEDMTLEKIFGRAIYALLAFVGRYALYRDDSQEALMICDECHHMTSSPEGEQEICDVVRYGRKHKAAVALGSHDATEDFGSKVLQDLIPIRFVFRARGKGIAENNVFWLGLDRGSSEHAAMVKDVMTNVSPYGANDEVAEDRRGECYVRDHKLRIGKLRILTPHNPARTAAVLTTPPKRKDAGHDSPGSSPAGAPA
ncbi:ATP-binding protein [Arthrobacter sp. GAS37]|uniref:ATP-binding protein n=1 Tax=Arthrobacter sp. GAS37 TaxID=3156261 RepID=UPI00384ED451